MANSLRNRLLVAVGAVALTAVGTLAFSARLGTRVEFSKFRDLEREREDGRVRATTAAVAARLDGRCCGATDVDAAGELLEDGEVFFVFDERGALAATSGRGIDVSGVTATYRDATLNVSRREESGGVTAGVSVVLKGLDGEAIHLDAGRPATVFVVKWPRDDAGRPDQEFLGSIDRRLLIGTLSVGALALVVTWFVARGISRPIAELNRATTDLARGDFSRRVPAGGSDELSELARAFNQMAAELERQQTLRRNLVHDVAHELRTPLTSLRCRLETVIDGMVADPRPAVAHANEEVAHLSELVSDLEELARAEAGELSLSIGRVELADVVRSSARVAGLEGDARLRLPSDDGVAAKGDAMRIRQIVVNLLTNASRHTPEDGVITVSLDRRDGDVIVRVHNTGSSLTAEEAARVFDRFYRADPARQRATGGSGLGLAIVKHLAEVQNGSAYASSDQTGVLFSVTLPADVAVP